jgi:hypothetical protein
MCYHGQMDGKKNLKRAMMVCLKKAKKDNPEAKVKEIIYEFWSENEDLNLPKKIINRLRNEFQKAIEELDLQEKKEMKVSEIEVKKWMTKSQSEIC